LVILSDPPHALLKPEVLDLVRLKRALRRRFMRSRDPADKREYRRAEDDLKKLLLRTKSENFADMLRNADPTKPYGFNLWKLTKKNVSDQFSLPRIDDILDQLGRAKYFSCLDLLSGFHQIELEETSRNITSFSTSNGSYHFTASSSAMQLPSMLRCPGTQMRLILR